MTEWTSGFDSTEEFKEHLQDKMQEFVGTRDLQEGNRRMTVLHEWRYNNE